MARTRQAARRGRRTPSPPPPPPKNWLISNFGDLRKFLGENYESKDKNLLSAPSFINFGAFDKITVANIVREYLPDIKNPTVKDVETIILKEDQKSPDPAKRPITNLYQGLFQHNNYYYLSQGDLEKWADSYNFEEEFDRSESQGSDDLEMFRLALEMVDKVELRIRWIVRNQTDNFYEFTEDFPELGLISQFWKDIINK